VSAGPATPEAVLNQARLLLRRGEDTEAEALLRVAVKAVPGHSGLLQYLGVLRLKRGDPAEAETLLAASVALNPAAVDHRVNFGNVLDARGEHAAAADCFRAALALEPGNAAVQANLGNALMKLGRLAEAAAAYASAVALKPGEARYRHALGAALIEAGRFAEAEAELEQAVALAPDAADAQLSLGLARARQGRHGAAESCYRRALEIDPNHLRALINLGGALLAQRRHEEFAATQRRALSLAPDYPEALANLAAALLVLGNWPEAEAAARRALALKPSLTEALSTLAASLERQGRVDEALALLRQAAHEGPMESRGEAHFGLALALLRRGDFALGWPEYEWRWGVRQHQRGAKRDFPQPQWRGEEIAGRTILLHGEQGLGDTIQFLRYVPMTAARGARVILEVPAGLKRLAVGVAGATRIVAAGEALPPFDLHCPLLSLPLAFGTQAGSIPADTPYISAPRDAAAGWRARFAANPAGKKVGLVWAGNPGYVGDRDRSLDPGLLAPLFGISGTAFYSLQVGAAADGLRGVPGADRVTPLGAEFKDFADTAACVAALDLVIAADTAVAHLAGALNRPVWILLPFAADWRWLVDRTDSPWYRSAALFRQKKQGDWREVIERVAAKLASYASMVNI
jgi:Flp pilus assembly protein TadD